LKGLTSISELVLDHCARFTDAGFAHLAKLVGLRHLGLLRTPLTDKSMKVVGAFTALETLDLDYTSVSDTGLADLAGLKNLKWLGLDSTYVTEKSREVLLGFKALETLNLYHTLVPSSVYQELKNGMPSCRIIWEEESANPNRRRS
jgi:hypothetical protein